MLRRPAAISLASALIIAVLGVAAPVRAAVPATPNGLQPDGVAQAGIPILSWNRVSGATSYDVAVARPGAFDNPLWSAQTTNRRAVPTVQLPGGTLDWRVRARGTGGTSGWAQASFTKNAHLAPTPLSPEAGAILAQPSEPALLSWTPVRGAVGYTVQVGTDSNFVDTSLFKSYTTKTSSYVVPDPLVATQYFWRVQADMGSGIVTDWSVSSGYQIGGLAKAVLVAPADSPSTSVKDVVLDWQPVLGAKTYNLQISTDQNFNTLVTSPTGITGTRYSPPVTLANDQYYWRVTPVDSAGNKLDWLDVDTWTFRRHWPDQPSLEFPGHQAVVGDPFYYQWTPVPLASSYRIELSTTADFTGFIRTCETTNTTYVPINKDDCQPLALGTYYWRVIAIDAPGRTTDSQQIVTDRIVAEVRRFTYDPDQVQLVSPANGASVEIPTLTWNPVAGAAKYKVTLASTDGGAGGGTFTTTATSFTPRTKLTVGKTYRWQVQPVTQSLREGALLTAGSQPTFTVVASTATPGPRPEPTSPAGISGARFPTLEWSEVTGATNYRLLVREAGTIGGYTRLTPQFAYAAGEDDTANWLTPGTYEWSVEAYNGGAFISQALSTSTFTILPPTQVTGESLAMSGLALEDPATSCSKVLDPDQPLADQQCVDLRATPVLSWSPNAEVGYYKVWLARDEQMTNVVSGYPVDVETTHFTPRSSLIDSQAGSAFYWFVQPCKVDGKCAPLQHAQHAFNKLSKPVETLSPAVGGVQANDITFTWRDYLATNQDSGFPTLADHTGVYSVEPDVEAKQYRVQVDSDPNFQEPVLETALVDQTTFTSFSNTYPEGPLYWRVQAIDGSGNSLTWSDPVSFTKDSPKVTLLEPVGNEAISGAAPLRWTPLAYAASYDVEVYKSNDTVGSSANRVVTGNSKQVAFSMALPLEVSDTSYTWRVRPVDAKERKGPWTSLAAASAKFRVVGQSPIPTQPLNGAIVAGDDSLFAWQPVDGAATYRFERRLDGATGPVETRTTPATAWAPLSAIPNGSWEWRVSSLDSAGKVIRSSAWTTFRVDTSRPSVTSATPRTSALRSANFVVKFSEPVEGVSSGTYRIYKSGSTNPLTATVTRNTSTKATLNPATNLKAGTSYVIKLTSKIVDNADNKLTPYSWKVRAK